MTILMSEFKHYDSNFLPNYRYNIVAKGEVVNVDEAMHSFMDVQKVLEKTLR